jgi:AcrR family transcriptional regulator
MLIEDSSAGKLLSPRANRAGERRERILSAARALFTQHGFHASGVARIASDSGVRIGQLYRDFASKEDIVAALVEGDVLRFLDETALHDAVEARDFGLVHAWIERFMKEEPSDEADCALFVETISEATRNDRVADILRAIDGRVRDNILRALSFLAPGEHKALRRGDLASFIMAIGHGVWVRRISDPSVDRQRLSGYVAELIDAELTRLIATRD